MLVKRIRQGNNSTLSEIYVDNMLICYGLEDAVRELKIKVKQQSLQVTIP